MKKSSLEINNWWSGKTAEIHFETGNKCQRTKKEQEFIRTEFYFSIPFGIKNRDLASYEI